MKRNFFLFIIFSVLSYNSKAQRLPHIDSVDILLTNMAIQIECTSGVNDLYNFKFERAASQFKWIQRHYPEHPLPYFLLGLIEWWKIAPNIEKNTQYDERFLELMDSTVYFAERIFEEDENNAEAPFFLAGAYGFMGRLYSERSSWTRAAFAGKKALKYLEYSKNHTDLSPEILFGDGLYNYYSVWIPDNYPMLKPVMLLFDKGDKELGIQQLETVIKEAFYTKVEAQYFLMRIYSMEESKPLKALPIASYLYETYPDNPYFHRYYARLLYSLGRYAELKEVAQDILDKIDAKKTGYEEISGRYASFYLATIYRLQYRDDEMASKFYARAISFSEAIEAYESGYYLHSLSNLGRIAANEEEMDLAMQYYDKILEHASRKHSTHKEARSFKKEYKKYKRENG